MSDEVKQDHYDLLHRIERNDRRFRMAQSIFMTMIGLILVGLIAAQFVVIRNLQEQSAEQARSSQALQQSNKDLAEANKHLSEQTNRYIQCIAQFFATPDRSGLTLTDLDKCTYQDEGVAVPGLIITPSAQATQQPTTTPAPTNPGNGSQGQERAQERPAQRFLGVPLCIPFTNACVRR